jgi:hypothetical protein
VPGDYFIYFPLKIESVLGWRAEAPEWFGSTKKIIGK